MGSTPRHARPRLAAAAIAVVVLLCQAAAWVHTAATPHVTCVEHGESVHLGASQKAGAAAQRSEDHRQTAVAASVESVAHGHEHCGLIGHRSTSVTTSPAVSALAQAEPAPAPRPAPPGRVSVRILRLAPKTSPPGTPAV